jgi:hypothetical protein
MARITINIAVALILLNAGAGFLIASGVAEDWGVQPDPGGDERITDIEQESQDLETAGGTETLIGLYNAVAGSFSTLISIVFAAPTMLTNIGVPGFITAFLFAPLYLLVAADTIYVLSGRVLN